MDDELKRLRAENAALRMRNEELQRNVDALLAELESRAEGELLKRELARNRAEGI